MKRNLVALIIVFSTVDLIAQINLNNIIITIDGTYTESDVTTSISKTDGKYLNAGASIGVVSSDRFLVGIGLDYNWSREEKNIEIGNEYFALKDLMDIKSHVLLPGIFLVYYHPIMNKLYFSTRVKFSYGNIKTNYKIGYLDAGGFNNDSTILGPGDAYIHSYRLESESKSHLFSAQISPELTFFITKVIGINLGFGGIGYDLIDWDTENSNWTFNFNPVYWRLGIKFLIENQTPAIK